MILKKSKPEKSGLDEAIDEVLREMKGFTSDQDEYALMVAQLTKLHALKVNEKPDCLSKDTMAIVIGNLLAVGIIVGYERTNIISSKALTLLWKLR